ncbi:hypothetical protein IFM53868_06339 [Aspergillus udagawae]|uniref:Zn(2)-C6 fungal-type domain-containing protein n=1 Tax=Aspergillus udagawae TaxID=91492 RepID=A0ABQ1AZJ1_9EURO|nr:hypothetical protein IFM53868_06339 [Aspergillus udagawae]
MLDQQRQQPGNACEKCRRRRIRCDRTRPHCSACATAGVECIVQDSYPPRGPKKGYLRTLQKKIEELESQLEKQGTSPAPICQTVDNDSSTDNNENHTTTPKTTDILQWPATPVEFLFPTCARVGPNSNGLRSLDISHMHNDLDQLYFDRAYAFAPIIHTHRYRSWSKQPNKSRQRTCLQYAMWTLASSLSSQFHVHGCKLYAKTRQLLQELEGGEPCHQISLEQTQAWAFLSIYELTCQVFHRGMMSAGRALRLVQMMRLYELDMPRTPHTMQLDRYQWQLTPDQEDWVDTESKRRTFWFAYLIDRFTSLVDGLHMFFDEQLIQVRLPAPEANFIDVLMLYDLIESKPLGTSMEGTQLVQALHAEHQQQALDAVTDISLLVAVLGQHFQMHPLTPILLLLGARFSQSHPELNDACQAYAQHLNNVARLDGPQQGLTELSSTLKAPGRHVVLDGVLELWSFGDSSYLIPV